MKDPKEIAAGILARGKAQGGGVLCVGCHIGYMSPTCPTHGSIKEAHDKASREHTEKVMAYQSVTELSAKHGNLGEYIAQLESERDSLRAKLHALEGKGVTDDMVERAVAAFQKSMWSTDSYTSYDHKHMRAALQSALGAMGEGK